MKNIQILIFQSWKVMEISYYMWTLGYILCLEKTKKISKIEKKFFTKFFKMWFSDFGQKMHVPTLLDPFWQFSLRVYILCRKYPKIGSILFFVCRQLRKTGFFGRKMVKIGKIGKECSNHFNKARNESGTPNLVGLDPKNVKIAPCVPELEPISYLISHIV